MIDVIALYKTLEVPEEFAAAAERAFLAVPRKIAEKYIPALASAEYDSATKELETALAPDEKGLKIFAASLRSALLSREQYENEGISEKIFIDTMKCFPRFLRENKAEFGEYSFDRAFWTGRQLSLRLFRIGELEYEKGASADGEKEISVHIPSDAVLTAAKVDDSLAAAEAFFGRYYPDYAAVRYVCTSWLLSPALDTLLAPDSNILSFAARFRRAEFYPSDESYKQWVFRGRSLSPQNFPENTSLQKKLKAYVLAGGTVGESLGVLKNRKFSANGKSENKKRQK